MGSYLTGAKKEFLYYKNPVEKAIAQIPAEAPHWKPASGNSMGTHIQHMFGNMLS